MIHTSLYQNLGSGNPSDLRGIAIPSQVKNTNHVELTKGDGIWVIDNETKRTFVESLKELGISDPRIEEFLREAPHIYTQTRDSGASVLNAHILSLMSSIAFARSKDPEVVNIILIAGNHDRVEDLSISELCTINSRYGRDVVLGVGSLTKIPKYFFKKIGLNDLEISVIRMIEVMDRTFKGPEYLLEIKGEDRLNNLRGSINTSNVEEWKDYTLSKTKSYLAETTKIILPYFCEREDLAAKLQEAVSDSLISINRIDEKFGHEVERNMLQEEASIGMLLEREGFIVSSISKVRETFRSTLTKTDSILLGL